MADVNTSPAKGILLLNRWVKVIATLMGAEAGCIILTDRALARVVARYNIPHAFLANAAKSDHGLWQRDETVLITDARQRFDIHTLLGDIALESTGFFFRRPLIVDDIRTFSLLIYGTKPLPEPSRRALRAVEELAGAMVEELQRNYPADDHVASRSLRLTKADLNGWLRDTPTPTAVFDPELRLIALNAPMTALFPGFTDALIGQPLTSLAIPARESFAFLFQHAIINGITTPKLEVVLEDTGHRLQAMASPVTLLDAEAVLVVTAKPLDVSVPMRTGRRAVVKAGPERATVEFLAETLVRKRALRSRSGISYMTVRAWRQSIRQHQIRAIRAIKEGAPASLAEEIADDLEADIAALVGSGVFRGIVPMPCGHSLPEYCLSRLAAVALGRRLNLPVLHALAMQRVEGSSHPKTNLKRPPITLMHAVEGPLLLIDDIATSGRHIEEATQMLRASTGSVLALAWIGGDSADPAADDA